MTKPDYSWQFQFALVSAEREGVRQIFACISSHAPGALVLAGPTGKRAHVFLKVRTLSYTLSPPLKVQVHVPLPFQLPSGKYSYFPTQSSVDFGAAGSSGTRTHLPPKSTNLWPLSGSDSSHLSATQTRAPASLMVWPAFAALLPRTRSARGTAANSCLKFMMSFLRFR
jgi:hypothetical protein